MSVSNKDCERTRSALEDRLLGRSGEGDPRDDAALREHLQGCPGCRDHASSLEVANQVLGGARASYFGLRHSATQLPERLAEAVERERSRPSLGWLKWTAGGPLAAVAAALTVAVGLGIYWFGIDRPEPRSEWLLGDGGGGERASVTSAPLPSSPSAQLAQLRRAALAAKTTRVAPDKPLTLSLRPPSVPRPRLSLRPSWRPGSSPRARDAAPEEGHASPGTINAPEHG